MKKHLIPLLILLSFSAYSQDSIKIKNKIYTYIKIWPDTNQIIGQWFAEEKSGILLTFPSLEKDRKIKIIEYCIIEKNGNALITQDSLVRNVFWVYPYKTTLPDGKQPNLELQYWIKFQNKNLFYPVSKNGGEVFDKTGKVILKNVKWQELRKISEYKDGRYLIDDTTFVVNKKR